MQFSAGEVTLRAGDRSQTLTDVAALLETRPGKTQAQIDFQLAGAETRKTRPAFASSATARRRRRPRAFELSTDDNELPCSVLAMGIDELKPLGERCRFHGRIWADETPDGWDADVAGQLARLGPRPSGERSFSAPSERHRRGDDPLGPFPSRTAGRMQRRSRRRRAATSAVRC